MVEDKELDELLAKRQEHAIEQVSKKPKDMIEKGVEAAIVHQLENSNDVQERFLATGKKVVDTNLSAIENSAEAEEKAAILKNNKDACELYGIDEDTVPKWVVRCAKKVQDFWYAVWLIIGFFTTVPVVFLGKKIKVVLKKTWISMSLSMIVYIVAVTYPFWSKWFKA